MENRLISGHQSEEEGQFRAIEVLHGLWKLVPRHDNGDDGYLPTTTTERQRASTKDQSLDKDAHLPEKVTKQTGEACIGIEDEETTAGTKTVLYLAYGSNLSAKTFRGTRGIRPLSHVNVLVPSLRLTFDLPGVPYVEPCFAATRFRHASNEPSMDEKEPQPPKEDLLLLPSEKSRLVSQQLQQDYYHKDRWHKPLVGVVYEVTLADYARIIATEGGGRGYRDVVVDCFPFPKSYDSADPVPDVPSTQPFKAHTLLSPAAQADSMNVHDVSRSATVPSSEHVIPRVRPDQSYAQPSARYLDLIRTGAAEHDLPHAYRAYLAQIRPYRITSARQRVGQVLFLGTWGPGLLLVLFLSAFLARPDGRSPRWVMRLADALFVGIWGSYDAMFRRVFGDGERTNGE